MHSGRSSSAHLAYSGIVDGVAGRILAVAPEARPHHGVGDRQLAGRRAVSSRSDWTGRSRLTPPIASANRSGLASTNLRAVTDGLARLSIRIAFRTPCSSISSMQLGQVDRREHRLRTLEVVVAHLEHPAWAAARLRRSARSRGSQSPCASCHLLPCLTFRPAIVRLAVAEPTDLIDEHDLLRCLESRQVRPAVHIAATRAVRSCR